MLKRSVRGLVLAVVSVGLFGWFVAPPASATGSDNVNNPTYWQNQGWGSCVKYDPVSTPYVLGNPPSGYYWSLLVLKAGSESSNSDWLTQIPNPAKGSYYHPSGKSISHVIVCKKPGSQPSTTTTTTPGSNCNQYTPTRLAVSKSSAEPGETVTVSGSGKPGDVLNIKISRTGQQTYTLGNATVSAGGTFSLAVIIPDGYPAGSYTITVRSNGCTCPGTPTTTRPDNDNDNDRDNDRDSDRDGDRDSDRDSDHDNDNDNDRDNDDRHDNDRYNSREANDNDDGPSNPCYGSATTNITVTSLDLTGCGANNTDRVLTRGQTITWYLMGSPFDKNKPPVSLTLVSRTSGGPTYSLYSGTYPSSMTKNVTIPAAAPFGQYYLVQTGKDSKNKTVTKSCPVRVGLDAVLASSVSSNDNSVPRAVTSAAFIGLGAWTFVLLRRRRNA